MYYSLHVGDTTSEPLTKLKVSRNVEELETFADSNETCKKFGYIISEYCFSDLYKRWISEKVITQKKGQTR